MSKKPIIVFEGIEGSGKSYHINNVAKYLFKDVNVTYRLKAGEPTNFFNKVQVSELNQDFYTLYPPSRYGKLEALLLWFCRVSNWLTLYRSYHFEASWRLSHRTTYPLQ